MGFERKLLEWQAAGLVDRATADAIGAYEAERSRPIALWAAIGLGILALGLGTVLLVAANWDRIPAWLKLFVHLDLTAAAAVAAWYGLRHDRLWLGEAGLFLLAVLTLAGISLQAQVYQHTGPVWVALGWWAVLTTPALLIAGRTRLIAYGYAAALSALALSYGVDAGTGADMLDRLADNLPAALPPALVATSLLLGQREARAPFRDGLGEAGLFLMLAGGSAVHFAWANAVTAADVATILPRLLLGLATTGLAAWLAGRLPPAPRAVLRAALVGSAAAVVAAVAVPHGDNPVARFVGVLSYFALWGAIARTAHAAGWRMLFGTAVAMLAIRLFIVYIELFYDLAFTGLGLVVGGLLLIGLSLGWSRVVRRPPT